jgi:hypothetical protein
MASGETPTPSYQGLDYGQNQQANAGLLDFASTAQDQQQPDFKPSTPEEQFLYGPTDRPNEPITHGAPFGPGAPVSRFANETNQEFMTRVAQQLSSDPNAAPEVQAFASRVLRGM